MPTWLSAFRKERSVSHACAAVKKGRTTVYRHRKLDKKFADAWDSIFESITDDLEASLARRLIDGVRRPFNAGNGVVEWYTEYDNGASLRFLAQRRPHAYNRGAGDVGIVDNPQDTAAEIRDALRRMRELSVAKVPDAPPAPESEKPA